MLLNKTLKKKAFQVHFSPQTTQLFMDAKVNGFVIYKQKNISWFTFFFSQEKHKQELEDMRKAGHEALTIIVDEYKVED